MVHNRNYTKLWKQTMLKITKSCSCPPEDKWLFKFNNSDIRKSSSGLALALLLLTLSTYLPTHRSSRRELLCKIDVLKGSSKFTGKHLWWSLFLIVPGLKLLTIFTKVPFEMFDRVLNKSHRLGIT